MRYKEQLQTPAWHEKALQIKRRDNDEHLIKERIIKKRRNNGNKIY